MAFCGPFVAKAYFSGLGQLMPYILQVVLGFCVICGVMETNLTFIRESTVLGF
jgi:hypothetical protein